MSAPVAPLPLRVAAVLVALQGVAVFGYGVVSAINVSREQWLVAVSVTGFFCLYGAALVVCAALLLKLTSWARGPVLFAQLVWLGLAWNFRGPDTWQVAVLFAVAGGATLVGLLHPESRAALEEDF